MPGLAVFDCDDCVRELYEREEVVNNLVEVLGAGILRDDELDRAKLRNEVFRDPGKREKLSDLIHPLVRKECLEHGERAAKTAALRLVDIPLLFEGGLKYGPDISVVVATSPSTQRSRLKGRNPEFADDLVDAIIEAQLPILEKVNRADVSLWNEGPIKVLEEQISLLVTSLKLYE